MPDKYGHSTYSDLIDEIVGDMTLDGTLASEGDDTFKVWILRAEERICSMLNVKEQWTLKLLSGYDTYYFAENPRITGASPASPIVINTLNAHGLTTGDRISIARIVGVDGALGEFHVTVVTPTTFEIRFQYDVAGATNETPIRVTAFKHGFATGDTVTVANVLGNTAANGAWVITVVDQDNFTLNTSVGNGTYTGGGTATKLTTGVGTTYVGGGRYWKKQQVPTHFRDIHTIRALVNNFIQEIRVSDTRNLTHLESVDNIFLLGQATTYVYPVQAIIGTENTQDYLKVYPSPVLNMDGLMYGTLRINPNLYVDDPVSAGIHLPKQYDEAIRMFLRSRIAGYMKDYKSEMQYYGMFNSMVRGEGLQKSLHPRLRVTYT